MGSSSKDDDIEEIEVVEADPTGRYVRYNEILGEGAFKTVYKGFDEVNGLEIAWSTIKLSDKIFKSEKHLQSVCEEANLLKSLKHENIMRCFHSWVDYEKKTVNMITELFTSGSMARAAGGTPEFMAPELFEEEYDQLVDIYSFGMCLLQMVTRELPYSECTNSGQIYKKVSSGIKPAVLSKVTDPEVKQFIEKCLGPVSERPSAIELLNDPFLAASDSGSSAASSILSLSSESFISSTTSSTATTQMNCCSPAEVVKLTVSEKNRYKLQGKMTQNKASVSMNLWISESGNQAKKIQFEFFLLTDTICSVMEEMAKELELSAKDATLITKLMEELVTELVPGYNSVPESSSSEFHDVGQQSEPAESPCVENQGADEQLLPLEIALEHYSADKSVLDNLKTKNSSGIRDHHTSMSSLSDQILSNNHQDKLVWASFSHPQPETMLTAVNTTLPGCQRTCGNVTIPYPFGIGRGCSYGDNYVIVCDKQKDFSVPRLPGRQVLEISETQMKVTAPYAATSCNAAETGSGKNTWYNVNLTILPYAVSSTLNIFVVIGCHHYGLIETQATTHRETASCVALCTRQEDLLDEKCYGIGCCEAPIPKGLQVWNASLEKIYYNTSVSLGKCSYAYILEKSSFDFRDFQESGPPKLVPLVLDWYIPSELCKDAQTNPSTYLCQQNTACIDLEQTLGVTGYRCECIHGYQGNPYLSPGCTEIDECAQGNNPCSGTCVNTPGSYECHCPRGYYGDGRKDGTGCHPNSMKLIFGLARRRKERLQRAKNFKHNGGLLLQQQMSSKDGLIEKTRIFRAEELKKATDNFNEDRVLGHGGQGTVYKGMLSDGNIVAIKKSKIDGQRQLSQFINEVVILSEINHRNIVKLLGCCLETQVPLLVYEFIPNETLSKYIHDPREEFPITWEMRLQIAIDVSGALSYLHSASSKPIFHRDIKSSNILLDAKYRAKVSDFGTSRSVPTDKTHLTTCVQGTFGYLDPEYFRSHQFTEKSDVYSFGVVLVELLTGEKAIRTTDSLNGQSLVWWFLTAMENMDLYGILAVRVVKGGRKESILATANLAKQCLNMDGAQRPTMREVALQLEVISQMKDVTASHQNNSLEINEQKFTEIEVSASDSLLPPDESHTEVDCSLSSIGSVTSYFPHFLIKKS
ncbi:Wall-associated receptor kinase-like 9 [Bienertia sinuspersici]